MPYFSPDTPIAISAGDPAGIGPEIIGKAWEALNHQGGRPFFAVGDAGCFAPHWKGPVQKISQPEQAKSVFGNALPVLHLADFEPVSPGKPNEEGAKCALRAMEMAVGLTRNGNAVAIVTAPISKTQLFKVGFTHPGQTEFIAERCGVSKNNATMMLAAHDLRVIPMTTHIALADVPSALNAALVEDRIRSAHVGLQRNFGIAEPRLVVAGLNPHAGEAGAFGREELDIMAPVVAKLRNEGINVVGPLSADTLFHAEARAKYDAVLCGYHDQALVPIKTLYFDSAVNITLGLPIIRTSPDHGTAFEIAGQGIANPNSMIAAIKMASDAAKFRGAYEALQ